MRGTLAIFAVLMTFLGSNAFAANELESSPCFKEATEWANLFATASVGSPDIVEVSLDLDLPKMIRYGFKFGPSSGQIRDWIFISAKKDGCKVFDFNR